MNTTTVTSATAIKVKKEGKGILFTNSFLEFFTKTNPFIHILTYGGMVAFFLYLNTVPFSGSVVYFTVGFFSWTLVEYLLHRYLFHMHESRLQYMLHGVHHEYPRDRERLMMPPLPGMIIVSIFYGMYLLLFGVNAPVFTAGFVLGYMAYTFIHYIVHAWKPVPGLKFLWAHHLKHHNPVYEDKAYGVSSPLWDYIFGTMPEKKKQPANEH
jgi:4-hydroxysphinganine ceramide fatty acyl 2-hydroxylase